MTDYISFLIFIVLLSTLISIWKRDSDIYTIIRFFKMSLIFTILYFAVLGLKSFIGGV